MQCASPLDTSTDDIGREMLTSSSDFMVLMALTKARQSQWEGQAWTMNSSEVIAGMVQLTSTQLNCSTVRCSHLKFSCIPQATEFA